MALPSMIPSLNVSVGLTVIGPVEAGLAAAVVISRRAAASWTHEVGESNGAAGALRWVGSKTPSTTPTRTVTILGVALVACGLVVARLGATGVLPGSDVVTALGLDSAASMEDVFAETPPAGSVVGDAELGVADVVDETWAFACGFVELVDDGRDRRDLCGAARATESAAVLA